MLVNILGILDDARCDEVVRHGPEAAGSGWTPPRLALV
jgi:hypothetical protein